MKYLKYMKYKMNMKHIGHIAQLEDINQIEQSGKMDYTPSKTGGRGGVQLTLLLVAMVAMMVGFIGLTGCISSGDSKKYYQLVLQPATPPVTAVNDDDAIAIIAPHLDAILMVEPVDMEDIYDDYRIVYRTSPYQLNYYSYHFWIKKPRRMIRDAIQDYLAGTRYFKKVITGFSQGAPEFLLKVRVYIIEEVDQHYSWYSHTKMDMELKDFKTGEDILLHSFNRQSPLRRKKVEDLPQSVSQVIKEELVLMLDKLPAALKEREKKSKK